MITFLYTPAIKYLLNRCSEGGLIRQSTIVASAVLVAFVMAVTLAITTGVRVSQAQESTTAEPPTTAETTSGSPTAEDVVGTTIESRELADESRQPAEDSQGEDSKEPAVSGRTDSEGGVSEDTKKEPAESDKKQSGEKKEGVKQAPAGRPLFKEEPPDPYPGKKSVPVAGEDFPAFDQLVDNTTKGKFSGGGWKTKSTNPDAYGKNYRILRDSNGAQAARYKVNIPESDVYSVYAWWPNRVKGAEARFGVVTEAGTKWSRVDQSRDGGYWVPIGEYQMNEGESKIKIAGVAGSDDVAVADAVAVVRGVQDMPPVPKDEAESGDEAIFSGQAARGIPRRQIIRRANRHMGTRYGNRRCVAYVQEDCSCFTKLVFKKWRKLPDSPRWQWKKGRKVARSNLRRGDLVFFDINTDGRLGHWDHVGIYMGNRVVIHANTYGRQVNKTQLKYFKGYWGAKRLRR